MGGAGAASASFSAGQVPRRGRSDRRRAPGVAPNTRTKYTAGTTNMRRRDDVVVEIP